MKLIRCSFAPPPSTVLFSRCCAAFRRDICLGYPSFPDWLVVLLTVEGREKEMTRPLPSGSLLLSFVPPLSLYSISTQFPSIEKEISPLNRLIDTYTTKTEEITEERQKSKREFIAGYGRFLFGLFNREEEEIRSRIFIWTIRCWDCHLSRKW